MKKQVASSTNASGGKIVTNGVGGDETRGIRPAMVRLYARAAPNESV